MLLDHEKDALSTKDDLVKSKLIAEKNVVSVLEALGAATVKKVDVEDLLDPALYEALVRESYSSELKVETMTLNANIPRIAKRVESALGDLGIEFHKMHPPCLLLKKMAIEPAKVLTAESSKRLEMLFAIVNERLQRHVARGSGAFR